MAEGNGFEGKMQELNGCVDRLNGCIAFLENRTAEHQRLLLNVRQLLKQTLDLRAKVELLGADPGKTGDRTPQAPTGADPIYSFQSDESSQDMVEHLLFEIDQEWNGVDKESGLEPELH